MTERLIDFAHVFKSTIPGAAFYEGPFYGVTAAYSVRVTLDYARAANAEHATAYVQTLAEQMRTRAIRELGLEPILDAQKAEVRDTARRLDLLRAALRSREERIAELEEQLAILTAGSG